MGMANIIANIINITKVLMANWSLMLLLHNLHSKEWNPLGRHHKRRPPSSQISKTESFFVSERRPLAETTQLLARNNLHPTWCLGKQKHHQTQVNLMQHIHHKNEPKDKKPAIIQ